MSKPIIAVDIDNVLARHADALMDLYNDTYGTSFSAYDYDEQWSWMDDKARMDDFHPKFIASGLHGRMEPLVGSQEAIRILHQKYDLVIITARWKEVVELTLDWVNKNFPGMFIGVHFAQIWQENGNMVSKAEIGKQLGAAYLIDDNLSHCLLAAEAGISSVLFGDYGWNKKETLPKLVVRAESWQAVQEYFDGLSR